MNFTDKYRRIHQKPVTESDPTPGNNAFLYSGYASVVGLVSYHDKQEILYCWMDCLTDYGYNRHPDGNVYPASSHDELVGISLLYGVGMWPILPELERNKWQVCNLEGFEPKSWWKLNPLKVIRDFWRLSKEENPRKATYKYPYIWPIIFTIRPNHRYFIKRMGRKKPTIWETINHHLASSFTAANGSNSSKVMLGFKLIALRDTLRETYAEQGLRETIFEGMDFKDEVREYFSPYLEHPITLALQKIEL